MLRVCRTCLQKISDINFISLNGGIQSLQIKCELTLCVPEMVLDSVTESVMCTSCVGALHSAYDFKRLCLQTEERIQNYIENVHLSTNPIDLINVCSLEHTSEGRINSNFKTNSDELESRFDKYGAVNLKQKHEEENVKEELPSSDEEVGSQHYQIARKCLLNMMRFPGSNSFEAAAQLKQDFRSEFDNCDGELSTGNSEDGQKVEKPFWCTKCNYRSAEKSKLKRHFLTHSSIKPFKCTFCDFNTRRKDTLTIHMREHNGEKPYQCACCEFSAVSKYALNMHCMQTHGEEKPHKCPKCKYRAVEKSTLHRHMAVHSSDKPFKCDQCNFSTAWKYTWAKHMQGHSGMTYKCDLCNYSTIYKHNLNLHVVRHSGDKPFQCSKCDYKAAEKSKLKRHVLTHGSVKPFICDICNFGTTRNDTLKKHMMSHMRNNSTQLSLD